MTERERWTVYPLLFLSLGIGLRSHITSSLDLHDITCHTLKSREVEIDRRRRQCSARLVVSPRRRVAAV